MARILACALFAAAAAQTGTSVPCADPAWCSGLAVASAQEIYVAGMIRANVPLPGGVLARPK